MKDKIWQYDEMIQSGASHSELDRARSYDENMLKFRNYEKEAEIIIENLGIEKDNTVIEFGCGTGALTIEFAKKCKKLIAVDVAKPMLDILAEKAAKLSIINIGFVNAGFLSYMHKSEPVDAIITKGALHHLPDFWKVIALQRLNTMLKEGGKLVLSDVIFSFDIKDYHKEINMFLENLQDKTGEELYNDAVTHIKDEFSTFDWVIDDMLKKTNFQTGKKIIKSKTNIDYYCVKGE
jgi:ubiquinone/menaquinone biosynthesis C-methylase UbiE